MVQLAGHDMLKQRGIVLIAASAPTHFTEDTPTAVLVRQVLGAIAEFDKTTLVAKLAAARQRKRMATGVKVEGRKSHAEERPEVVALAKALRAQEAEGRAAVSLAPSRPSWRRGASSTSGACRSITSRSPPCWRPEGHASPTGVTRDMIAERSARGAGGWRKPFGRVGAEVSSNNCAGALIYRR